MGHSESKCLAREKQKESVNFASFEDEYEEEGPSQEEPEPVTMIVEGGEDG